MPRVSYVNGKYLPHAKAMVNVEDRGYQLADGVYEVITIFNRCLIDKAAHFERLRRSLNELRIDLPVNISALGLIIDETIRKNHLAYGKVYIQITRGVAPRDHAFPDKSESTLVVTVSHMTLPSRSDAKQGCSVVTEPDFRWKRCDIKSISLLPNVLAKQHALEAGADETWMVNYEGYVTEGTASNAWIVTANNALVTRQTDDHILAGVTRKTILRLLNEQGVIIEERAFTVLEAKNAKEAFFTSSTAFIKPVTQIDGTTIGNGAPGIMTCTLIDRYFEFIESLAKLDGRTCYVSESDNL